MAAKRLRDWRKFLLNSNVKQQRCCATKVFHDRNSVTNIRWRCVIGGSRSNWKCETRAAIWLPHFIVLTANVTVTRRSKARLRLLARACVRLGWWKSLRKKRSHPGKADQMAMFTDEMSLRPGRS